MVNALLGRERRGRGRERQKRKTVNDGWTDGRMNGCTDGARG